MPKRAPEFYSPLEIFLIESGNGAFWQNLEIISEGLWTNIKKINESEERKSTNAISLLFRVYFQAMTMVFSPKRHQIAYLFIKTRHLSTVLRPTQ